MKLYNLRISRSLGVATAALISVVFYLIIVLVLNLSQNMIDPTGESYSEVFGIAQVVIVSLYWLVINYFFFSRPGKSGFGTILFYLLFMLLPIIAFTAATVVLIRYYPTSDFIQSWNLVTWVIGPTLFWYLPYSFFNFMLGDTVSIALLLIVCLGYNICMIAIGIVLGLLRRSYVIEKEEALRKQNAARYDVIIEAGNEAELVTNMDEEDEIFEVTPEPVSPDIANMEETEMINMEIDRLNEDNNLEEDEFDNNG